MLSFKLVGLSNVKLDFKLKSSQKLYADPKQDRSHVDNAN